MRYAPLVTGLGQLTPQEYQHYGRHLLLPEVGEEGQRRLKAARVLMIGAGGLGSPLGLYLAAAGVGTLGIVEDDHIESSNLHRQVLYGVDQVGQPKLDSALARLHALNPHVTLVPHAQRLGADNALQLLGQYDLIIDGTDNFPTRYLVNDACVVLGKPFVSAAIAAFEGQLSVFWPGQGPCYRCLYPEAPPPALAPSCAEGGVLGVLPGIMGTLQANEAIKILLGIGAPLVGRLLVFDALQMLFQQFPLQRRDDCPICRAAAPRLLDSYEQACALPQAVPELSPAAVERMLSEAQPFTLLDVREDAEWARMRIAGACHMPLTILPERAASLDASLPIVVYCQAGVRSRRAAELLRAQGLTSVHSMRGGIQAWRGQLA
jgi:molybdopterin/thiamine biosynthesis adenylyltransferase/rhodanese-related sulfurtransferase